MDIARWGLGIDTLANSVLSYGGRFGYEDAGDTPNTEVTILEFGPDKTLVFEVRGLKTGDLQGERIGTIIYGSEGYLVTPDLSSGSTITTATVFDPQGKLVKTFSHGDDPFGAHLANFFSAIRGGRGLEPPGTAPLLSGVGGGSTPETVPLLPLRFSGEGRRKRGLHPPLALWPPSQGDGVLAAPILDGHLSAALCHLGNISYRLGTARTPPARPSISSKASKTASMPKQRSTA